MSNFCGKPVFVDSFFFHFGILLVPSKIYAGGKQFSLMLDHSTTGDSEEKGNHGVTTGFGVFFLEPLA